MRTIVIGDLHGCYDEALELLARVGATSKLTHVGQTLLCTTASGLPGLSQCSWLVRCVAGWENLVA